MYDPQLDAVLFAIHKGNPSVRELAAICGLKSPGGMHKKLKRWKADGLITWTEGIHRSYELGDTGKEYIKQNYG